MVDFSSVRLVQTERELELCDREIRAYKRTFPRAKLSNDLETRSLVEGLFPNPYPHPDDPSKLASVVALCQIGTDPGYGSDWERQWLIRPDRGIGEGVLRTFLSNTLADGTKILGQNYKYDWRYLWRYYHVYVKEMIDLMLMSQLLRAGLKGADTKHSMVGLSKFFLKKKLFEQISGIPLDEYDKFKDEFSVSDWLAPDLSDDQIKYGALDVILPFHLYEKMKAYLDDGLSSGKFHELIIQRILQESTNIRTYGMMELSGVPYDKDWHLKEVLPWIHKKLGEAEKGYGEYFNVTETKGLGRGKKRVFYEDTRPINIKSAPQVKAALLPYVGKLESTDEKHLKRVQHKHPGIKFILQARKARTMLDNYGEEMSKQAYSDGRFRPSWFQIGMEERAITTGRSSSAHPNMQKIPARELLFGEKRAGTLFRRMIKARPGYKIVSLDYSTIEPRATAQETKDPNLIRELRKGKDADVHALTGQALLGLAAPPAKKTDERELVGKIGNLALGYMIGPYGLAQFMWDKTDGKINWLENDCALAKEAIDKYFTMFALVKRRMDFIEWKIKKSLFRHSSLAEWKGQKCIYIQHCSSGRHREFALTDEEEELARDNPEVLHKSYKASDPETGKYQQNLYYRKLNSMLREAYNFTIQGLCADILKIALEWTHDLLMERGIPEALIIACHDEIVLELPEELVDVIAPLVEAIMVRAGEIFIKEVPVVVNWSAGDSWDAK
jgi:DNA polymerase-1